MILILMFIWLVPMINKKLMMWWGNIGVLSMTILMLMLNYPLNENIKMMYSWLTLDVISLGLIILSMFLVILMYLASSMILNKKYFEVIYEWFMGFLLISLVLSFLSSNFIMFYFMFEMSLIPTLLIIVGWGYQPERLQAGVYMMMYTLIASLPLLFSLIYLLNHPLGGFMWDYYLFESYKWFLNAGDYIIIMSMGLAFLIKLPLFLVHLWLPKAHVEAPVAGSMVLAGVLLKLGGYGLSRAMMKFSGLLQFNFILIGLSLVGMFIIGLVCCRLNDLKALVAYSSVAHMGLVVCGLFSGLMWGLTGSIMMMISHGLSSSGLFCYMNMMYERSGSRSIYINKGVMVLAPLFSLFLFMLCCSNISAPPTINLMAEIFLIISLFNFSLFSMLVFPLGSFLGAVFTFYMFSYVHHGKGFNEFGSSNGSCLIELHTLSIHLIPINILVLKSDLFISLF